MFSRKYEKNILKCSSLNLLKGKIEMTNFKGKDIYSTILKLKLYVNQNIFIN